MAAPQPVATDPRHALRLRDGEREIEASGSAAFVRQLIDDLPNLFARLRGENGVGARTAAISMPAFPQAGTPVSTVGQPAPVATADNIAPAERPVGAAAPHSRRSARRHTDAPSSRASNGQGGVDALEGKILDTLQGSPTPLTVAAIRAELPGTVSGQLVRRILERSDRVAATVDRPAAYRLR